MSTAPSPFNRRPALRSLRIFAIDPMVARGGDHHVTVQVRHEPLAPSRDDGKTPVSFRGRRVEVVDVDASGPEPVWIHPVNLDDTYVAMQHGLEPSEADPHFHQQMVYAVAMRTLEQFDRALGRTVYFREQRRLRLVPHAFRGANAFYHPSLRAVLFGYFSASRDTPGENLPGQTVFTCLSHDIIAHEVTHAVVDRLRPFFNTVDSPQVRAFHEAFADIVAVFQRLAYPELVRRALQDARGDITQATLLSNIAAQFGQGLGGGRALRSAIEGRFTMRDAREEHDLGSVLVAAVFDGFARTYERRIADLLRIATGGTGMLPSGAVHPDLVGRFTAECVRTAQAVLTMCIRAFDYLPPAYVTFGAFLRALVTADAELNPDDESGVRASMIEAFRRREIFAEDAGSLSVSALLLAEEPENAWSSHRDRFREWIDLALRAEVEWQRFDDDREDTEDVAVTEPKARSTRQAPPVLSNPLDAKAGASGVKSWNDLRHAVNAWWDSLSERERNRLRLPERRGGSAVFIDTRVSHRTHADGSLRFGLVVQLVEQCDRCIEGRAFTFPTGATMVLDVTGSVRFIVRTPVLDEARDADLADVVRRARRDPLGWRFDPADEPNLFKVDYRGMHAARTR